MKLWEYTGEELIGGAEITSDVILAPEIEMPWETDKVEGIISMPNSATAPAIGHKGLADQVLLECHGDGWKCVGHYVDDTIMWCGVVWCGAKQQSSVTRRILARHRLRRCLPL